MITNYKVGSAELRETLDKLQETVSSASTVLVTVYIAQQHLCITDLHPVCPSACDIITLYAVCWPRSQLALLLSRFCVGSFAVEVLWRAELQRLEGLWQRWTIGARLMLLRGQTRLWKRNHDRYRQSAPAGKIYLFCFSCWSFRNSR